MYAKVTMTDCFVLSNEVVEKQKKVLENNGSESIHNYEQRELSVNQSGAKQNFKVIVPVTSHYDIHKSYDFKGVISAGLFNGKEWSKLTIDVVEPPKK